MNTNLDPPIPSERPAIWQQKSSNESSIFDFVFGVFMPIVCICLDPALFYNGAPCSNIRTPFAPYPIFIYTSVWLGIILLAVWLVLRQRITRRLGLIAGIFFVGSGVAVIIGIVLLPMSLLGLLVCLGVLGFIPFLTAYVYFRNGLRALSRAKEQNPSQSMPRLVTSILTGVLLILCIPTFLQWQAPLLFPQWQTEMHYVDSCASE